LGDTAVRIRGGLVSRVIDIESASVVAEGEDPMGTAVDVKEDSLVGLEGSLDGRGSGDLSLVGVAERSNSTPDEGVSRESTMSLEPVVEGARVSEGTVDLDAVTGHHHSA